MSRPVKSHFIIPIFIGGAGCPAAGKCVFCDQSLTGGDAVHFSRAGEFVSSYIEKVLAALPTGTAAGAGITFEPAFYGGTFTAIGAAEMAVALDAARNGVRGAAERHAGSGVSISFGGTRVSTRPDRIDEGILRILVDGGVRIVEIGGESFDDGVLRAAGRDYPGDAVRAAAQAVNAFGMELSIHLMCGLPGQTRAVFKADVASVISLAPQYARIHPLCVMRGTPAERMLASSPELFSADDELIAQTAFAMASLELSGIRVIRVGILENAKFRDAVVRGPAHPNLREIAEGAIHSSIFDAIRSRFPGAAKLEVFTESQKAANYVKGFRSENLKKNSDIFLEFKNELLYNEFSTGVPYIQVIDTQHGSYSISFTRAEVLQEYINNI